MNLKEELERISVDYNHANNYIKQMESTLNAMLVENDAFQAYMRQQYGHKLCQDKIDEEVKKY